ncbi:hypothetical protein [Aquabacterium sp.]|uniref:hypothetical protein n=1 Tax=Aquabacterium sp. TaxID=1872578 RepID=UPI003784F4D8
MKTTATPPRTASLHDIVGQVAAEVAAPLTRALERVHLLAAGETLPPQELQALSEEVAHARRIGILGQQIARLAGGLVRQTQEPLDLTRTVLELLDEHRQDAGAAGSEIRDSLSNATVMGDVSLAGTLLRAMLDWASECALTAIDLRLDARPAAAQAVLLCRFTPRPHAGDEREPLSWHLMQFAARAMDVKIQLDTTPTQTLLTMQFERLVAMPATHTQAAGSDARLLAGRQVLVMAPDRDIRNQVRLAVQGLDLMVDYVTSVDAARDYCADGLPHAVVYASTLAGAPLDRLRRSLLDEAGAPPFIEIAAQGHGFEPVAPGETAIAKVGLDGLAQALPAALVIELSRRR